MSPLSDCAVTQSLVMHEAIVALVRNGSPAAAVLDLVEHSDPTGVERAAADYIEGVAAVFTQHGAVAA